MGERMKTFLKWLRFPRILLVVAVIAFLMAVLIPAPIFETSPSINTAGFLVDKIFEMVSEGYTKTRILNSLTQAEKDMLKENDINWIESIPVRIGHRTVNPEYLPNRHVVVYGTAGFRSRRKVWRRQFFLNATGQEVRLRRIDSDASKYKFSLPELQELINTTRVGTFDILLGNVTDISELPDPNEHNRDVLYEYLVLKKIIDKAPDCIEYAIEVMKKKSYLLNIRVDHLLRKCIVSPMPPDTPGFYAEESNSAWKAWCTKNAAKVEFTNDFLFEKH
jgi:hypothetical protein